MNQIEWKYVKRNISSEDIENFEKIADIKIPSDIRDFILEHNNGRPKKNTFNTKKSDGRVFDKLLSFNQNDKENIFGAYSILYDNKYFLKNIFAIASDPFGNFICLDKSNGFSVVFWEHETASIEDTGKDFLGFVKDLY